MQSRRELRQKVLATAAAAVVGRGMMKSARVPTIVEKIGRRSISAGKLPPGWHLYEICGQSIFPVYGSSGGITTRLMSWIVRDSPNIEGSWEAIPVEFSELEFIAIDYNQKGIERLVRHRIAEAIRKAETTTVNVKEGGCFPLPRRREA